MIKPYYEDSNVKLFLGDSSDIMNQLYEQNETFDLGFIDPPYFLSTKNGITWSKGRMAICDKGDWDRKAGFDQEMKFHESWFTNFSKLLNDNASAWICGTFHNIFKIGYLIQKFNLRILNDVIWAKGNPPPNVGCRTLQHSHESLIWFSKDSKAKHTFNYKISKRWYDEVDIIKKRDFQMRDVWYINIVQQSEQIFGEHPTQKPLNLLSRCLLISSGGDKKMIDPFCGSGTSLVMSTILGMKSVGIDNNEDYLKVSIKRIKDVYDNKNYYYDRYVKNFLSDLKQL